MRKIHGWDNPCSSSSCGISIPEERITSVETNGLLHHMWHNIGDDNNDDDGGGD